MWTRVGVTDIDNGVYPVGTKLIVLDKDTLEEFETEIKGYEGYGTALYAVVAPYGHDDEIYIYDTNNREVHLK